VRNLLKCREDKRPDGAYNVLKTVSKGLHLLMQQLLLDPPAGRGLYGHRFFAEGHRLIS
jgi:hypothetical protein